MDDLGDRMKAYERPWSNTLPPNSWVLVRVDGRAFHTWTQNAERPFDENVRAAMVAACEVVASDMSGFRLAYTQSDEATFLFTDTADFNSQLWFGGSIPKIISIAAAGFTAAFNQAIRNLGINTWPPAMFDARVFTMPADDVPNVFVWRQRDWERNSLQMLARHHFTYDQLHGKINSDLHELLHSVGVNWAHLPGQWKNGTFLYRDTVRGFTQDTDKHTWESLTRLLHGEPYTP